MAGELVAISRHCASKHPMVRPAAVAVDVDSTVREFLFSYTRSAEDLEDALGIYRQSIATTNQELHGINDIEEEILEMACVRLRDDADVFRKRVQLAASADSRSDEEWGVEKSYWNPKDSKLVAAAKDRIDAKEELEKETKRAQAREQREAHEQYQQQAVSALGGMVGLIQQKVTRNWIRPPSVDDGLEVLISVSVTRSGEVISAEVARSSGSEKFDKSSLRAVLKASPLPFPANPKYYEFISNFNILFKPQG